MPIHDQQQQPAEPAQQAIQPQQQAIQPQQPEPQPEPVSDDRYELMGDVRMQDDTMSMSQIVEGLDSGNPIAIEQFNLGTDGAGNPVATFRTPGGIMQHIKLSSSQWLGIRDQRNENRKKMATYQYNQDKLQKKRQELRGVFDNSLDTINDPEFKALMESQFEEYPQETLAKIIEWRRLTHKDGDAADLLVQKIKTDQAIAVSGRTIEEYEKSESTFNKGMTARYNAGKQDTAQNPADVQRRYQSDARISEAMGAAKRYSPVGSAASSTPLVALGPVGAKAAYGAWLKALEAGTGTGDAYAIPHPSTRSFNERLPEIMEGLNSIARRVGWQQPITEADLPQILAAVDSHYNVEGATMRIQQLEKEIADYEKKEEKYERAMESYNAIPSGPGFNIQQYARKPEDPVNRVSERSDRPVTEADRQFDRDVAGIEKGRGSARREKATTLRESTAANFAAYNKRASEITEELDELAIKIDELELDGEPNEAGRKAIDRWELRMKELEQEMTDIQIDPETLLRDIFGGNTDEYDAARQDPSHELHLEAMQILNLILKQK